MLIEGAISGVFFVKLREPFWEQFLVIITFSTIGTKDPQKSER